MTVFPQMMMPGATGGVEYEIEFVGADASSTASTLTLSTHQTNDLIIAAAYREGNTTPPSIPGGYTTLWSNLDGWGGSFVNAYKFAASGSETFGTFTGASAVSFSIYRNVNQSNPFSSLRGAMNDNTQVGWRSDGGTIESPGYAWLIDYGHGESGADPANFIRTGNTLRTPSGSMASRWILFSDSNGPVTSYGAENVTTGSPGENFTYSWTMNPIGRP